MYKAHYQASWALIIGIDRYQYCTPLGCAKQDAEGVASALETQFGFERSRMTVLLDGEATRARILAEYLRLAGSTTSEDDKVVVFFAGHGATFPGRRGDVGHLIPVDGELGKLDTLIRWDEFTRNADLIAAKHIVFIMDACYSGLAIHRAVGPGATRFLKDMLQRHARQVIAAGKANQTVADAGGPRDGHSMFTGHLLNALEGGAESDGVISANGVMSYVYSRVSKDQHSTQTPHYGFLDGDGDFVFKPLSQTAAAISAGAETEIMVQVPADADPQEDALPPTLADTLKDLLADPTKRIRLDDLVNQLLRGALGELEAKRRDTNAAPINAETAAERIAEFDAAIADLVVTMALLGRWATPEQVPAMARIVSRVAEQTEVSGGYLAWIGLQWYAASRLLHVGAIAALSAENMPALAGLFRARTQSKRADKETPVFLAINNGISEANDVFKLLPGLEQKYLPRSEFMHTSVQPVLEDLLFLGPAYEGLFDRFEVLNALAHVDAKEGSSDWGPPGRFAWKARHSVVSPFEAIIAEAEALGVNWPPLRAGMFGGDLERFRRATERFRSALTRFQFY